MLGLVTPLSLKQGLITFPTDVRHWGDVEGLLLYQYNVSGGTALSVSRFSRRHMIENC